MLELKDFLGGQPEWSSLLGKPQGLAALDLGGNEIGSYAIDLQASRFSPDAIPSGKNSLAIGNNNKVAGLASLAIGYVNIGDSQYSTQIGSYHSAYAEKVVNIGCWNYTTGGSAVNIGEQNTCGATFGITLGVFNNIPQNDFPGTYLIAIGNSNKLNTRGIYGMCIGHNNELALEAGTSSAAIGNKNYISSYHSVALGGDNELNGKYSIACGQDNVVSGLKGLSFGYKNTSSKECSLSLGVNNTSSGTKSTAIGENNTSGAERSVALGSYNSANSKYSCSIGYSNTVNDSGLIAFGRYNNSNSYHSIAIGRHNYAGSGDTSPYNPIAIGAYCKAYSHNSLAIGSFSEASGEHSSSIGFCAVACLDNTVNIGGMISAKNRNLLPASQDLLSHETSIQRDNSGAEIILLSDPIPVDKATHFIESLPESDLIKMRSEFYPTEVGLIVFSFAEGASLTAQPEIMFGDIDAITASWQSETAFDKNDLIVPTNTNGFCYLCVTPGTTSATEPTWPTSHGQGIPDGSVVWEAIDQSFVTELVQAETVSGLTGKNKRKRYTNLQTEDGLYTLHAGISSPGTIDTSGMTIYSWEASKTHYLRNVVVRPTSDNGYVYRLIELPAINAGTTGSSEPSWPTTIGDVVEDNNIKWRCEAPIMVRFYWKGFLVDGEKVN